LEEGKRLSILEGMESFFSLSSGLLFGRVQDPSLRVCDIGYINKGILQFSRENERRLHFLTLSLECILMHQLFIVDHLKTRGNQIFLSDVPELLFQLRKVLRVNLGDTFFVQPEN
jgi:hypothetical protein